VANRVTTPATGFYFDVIAASSLNTGYFIQVRFPLKKYETIYISRSTAGGILLQFEEAENIVNQLGF
jgi:hypothetical protein